MDLTDKKIWVLIKHYDQQTSDNKIVKNSLNQVTLPSLLTFAELKSTVYSWADIKEDNLKVVKIRQYDNSLIPLSALFKGSSEEKPFIIEVVKIHQFCPMKKKTIPPGYISALKSKLTDLEKRVITVENSIPEIATVHIKIIEKSASQLSNCVGYLDRRLDELAPLDWKAQIGSSV